MKKNLIIFGLVGIFSINCSYANLSYTNLSCHGFANRLLFNHHMGTQDDISPLVHRAAFNGDSHLPDFEIIAKNYAPVLGDRFRAFPMGRTFWQISYVSNFEPRVLGRFEIQRKGRYVRTYLFDVAEGQCVLNNIHVTFSPETSFYGEEMLLDYGRCLKLATDHLLDDLINVEVYKISKKDDFDLMMPLTKNERLAMIYGPVCSLALPYFEESQR